MVDGGHQSGIEALEIGGVGDVAGVGDRVDASRDGRLELGEPLAEAERKHRPRLLEGNRVLAGSARALRGS